MKRSLFKYFKEFCYAEDFLEGKLLFRSLAYFRDIEDAARGDQYEGIPRRKADANDSALYHSLLGFVVSDKCANLSQLANHKTTPKVTWIVRGLDQRRPGIGQLFLSRFL